MKLRYKNPKYNKKIRSRTVFKERMLHSILILKQELVLVFEVI
jgi:hypothetical protein